MQINDLRNENKHTADINPFTLYRNHVTWRDLIKVTVVPWMRWLSTLRYPMKINNVCNHSLKTTSTITYASADTDARAWRKTWRLFAIYNSSSQTIHWKLLILHRCLGFAASRVNSLEKATSLNALWLLECENSASIS